MNPTIYIDKGKKRRWCSRCSDPIERGKHHLAVIKDYRTNLCRACLLNLAEEITFCDELEESLP
jgi:hypothetical protein